MKSVLVKNKKIIIIIIVILLVLFVLGIRSAIEKTSQVIPTPTPIPSPTPIPFSLINIFPSAGTQEMANPSIALQYTFSSKIDLNTAKVTVKPYIETAFSKDESETTLYVRPTGEWKFETEYTLEIDIKSQNRESLTEKIEHSFKFTNPIDSPLTE